jgi:hypothetical protein
VRATPESDPEVPRRGGDNLSLICGVECTGLTDAVRHRNRFSTNYHSLSFWIFSPVFSMSVPIPCIVLQPIDAMVAKIEIANTAMILNLFMLMVFMFTVVVN